MWEIAKINIENNEDIADNEDIEIISPRIQNLSLMETVLIDSDSDNSDNSDNSSFGDDYEFLNIDDIANEKKEN